MSKNIIDQIIADKLSGLNFEFKAEYWNKMQESIEADCAQTNTCSSTSMSGLLTGGLIATFTIVIGLIAFFPWSFNVDSGNQKQQICNDTAVSIDATITETPLSISDIHISKSKIENQEVKQAKTKVADKKLSTTKAKAKHKKIRITAKASPKQKIIKGSEPKINVATEPMDVPQSDSLASQNTTVKVDSFEKEIVEPIQKEEVSFEADSVYIREGKILGNEQEKTEKDIIVDVHSGPEPVKHVKTRSKPIKRVFKKRKGILYRMGLRK